MAILAAFLGGQSRGQTTIVHVAGEPEPRIVGIGRLAGRSGKQKGVGVEGGCQVIGASTALLGVQERHLRKGEHLVGAAASFDNRRMEIGDGVLGLLLVEVRQGPLPQHVPGLIAERVRRQDIAGEFLMDRGVVHALDADRPGAADGQKHPRQQNHAFEEISEDRPRHAEAPPAGNPMNHRL